MFTFFKKDKFNADTIILTIGTTIAQAIPVLSMLVFTRYFSDNVLGNYGLFIQVVAILSVVANGRLEQALFLLNNQKDARQVVYSAFTINIIFSLAILIFFVSVRVFAKNLVEGYPIFSYSYLLPLSVFLGGLVLAILFYSNYRGKFTLMSSARITQALIANGIPLIFILFNQDGPLGLILGFVLGQVTVILFFIIISRIKMNRLFNFPETAIIKQTTTRFRQLIYLNSPLLLVDQLSANIPLIFIYAYFGDSKAGQYSLASRLLLLPAVIIGSSVGQVFYKHLSDTKLNGSVAYQLILVTFKRLGIMSVLFFSASFFLSSPLMPFFFGKDWEIAGMIATLLSISMAVKFVVSPLSSVLLVYEQYKKLAIWQIMNLIFQLLLVGITIWIKADFVLYLSALIVCEVISYCFYLFLIFWVIKSKVLKIPLNT